MDKGSRMQPKDYIEEWYQEAVTPQYSSILQEVLAANLKVKTICHVIMHQSDTFRKFGYEYFRKFDFLFFA